MGTIIIWIVVVWFVCGAWSVYHLDKNQDYKEALYKHAEGKGIGREHHERVLFGAMLTAFLAGPLFIKAPIKLKGMTEGEIRELFNRL